MAAASSKPKIKKGSYKKLNSQQIRQIANATGNLENLALRVGTSRSTVMRVRRLEKQGKLVPSQITALKLYCFNETVRLLRSKKRKAKCNMIKTPHVIENYKESVKKNKKFEKLKGEKVPCLNWFKEQMKNFKNKSGSANCYVKDMLPNTDITPMQDLNRRYYTG